VVKVMGAIYLIWFGIKTFSDKAQVLDIKRAATETGRRLHAHYVKGLLVGSSNPKAILFFTAFFPQFLNPVEPFAPQYSILALTFIVCEFSVLAMCAFGVSAIEPNAARLGRGKPVLTAHAGCRGRIAARARTGS
jgi:threonine/homoserine/homoserine lactone efflux protein